MKIAIGSDHAGYKYKQLAIKYLSDKGHEMVDFGTHSEESCNYVDFIIPTVRAVAAGKCERGIVLGGSGNGEAIAANKINGIRCALCWDNRSARFSRQHNDANVMSIGQRMVSIEQVYEMLDIYLATAFEGGRHRARINQLEAYGSK
ncbi:MAG: ribose 5-phosphate isomerase B [Phycisphaerae bacterium]|jgi:ribose 5-phosphate isomerase B